MKKILLLFVSTLFIGASVVSCSSDDDKPNNSAKIVGKWNQVKMTYTALGESDEYLHEHLCPSMKDYVEFKDNGTALSVDHNEECLIEYEETLSWSITNGNTLNLSDGEESFSFKIQTLNNSVMILTQTEVEEGIEYTVKIEFERD